MTNYDCAYHHKIYYVRVSLVKDPVKKILNDKILYSVNNYKNIKYV